MKAGRYEMRFAGSGGQGIILCSIILAEAAFLAGKNVSQSQSYGPEARGSMCQAELIIDESEIVYPRVTYADFLLALTQASLERYLPCTAENALIVMDRSLSLPAGFETRRAAALPFLQTASEVVGNPLTANIAAAGAINAILEIAGEEMLVKAIRMHIPWGTEEINLRALKEGTKIGMAAR